LEKELAASEDVGELRLELGKDEDKLFAEVSDVFGQDDSVDNSLHLDDDVIQQQEGNSPANEIIDEASEVVMLTMLMSVNVRQQSVPHKRSREEDDDDDVEGMTGKLVCIDQPHLM